MTVFENELKPCGATKIEVDYFDVGHEIRMRWRRVDSFPKLWKQEVDEIEAEIEATHV